MFRVKFLLANVHLFSCIFSLGMASGEGDDYIINGRPVVAGERPYAIQLHFGGGYKCTGALIGKKFVVTARHCVEHVQVTDMSVVVGSHTVSMGQPNRKVFSVKKVYKHKNADVDVAILKLKKRVKLCNDVQVIPLDCTPPGIDKNGDISGWGQTVPDRNDGTFSDVLQTASVRTYPHENCQTEELEPKAHELCAGLHDAVNYTNACYGDSGGPFVSDNKLTGVISGGSTLCPSKKLYAIYTNVSYICDWMVQVLGCSIKGGRWSDDYVNTPVTSKGDKETLKGACPGGHVACVKCQKAGCDGVSETCQNKQKYRCSAKKGLVCLNKKQPTGCKCCDYSMKAMCYP